MLLCTLLSNFIDFNFIIAGNSVGCSLATNIVFWYHFNWTNKKYCWLTRNIPLGLIIMNLIDILGNYIDYQDYDKIFNIFICAIFLILAAVFYIRKRLGYD